MTPTVILDIAGLATGKPAMSIDLLLCALFMAFLSFVVMVMDRSKKIAAKDDWKFLAES